MTQKYKINRKLTLGDKFINLVTLEKDEKVKGYCGRCNNPVFNLNSRWTKRGVCVYCYDIVEKDDYIKELEEKILNRDKVK